MGDNLLRFRRRLKHYGRYSQIVGVLIRHGFGDLVDRMRIRSVFKVGRRSLTRESARLANLTFAERIRLAMEDLGPSFVKLGQVLSNRPFLIPPELVMELEKLQDEVAPCSFADIEKTVEDEFKCKLTELFRNFAEEPAASASLAQVHYAETNDGDRVAVKVLRPGVKEMLEVDMEILKDVAELLEKFVPESRQYEPVKQAQELARVTKREVDLYYEARNIEVFRANFKDYEDMEIPAVHWDLSGSKVMTTSIVDGIKVSHLDELRKRGYDLPLLAKRGTRFVLKMIFEDRFYHADPHPGNLFILEGNRWAPVDFGMVGQLSDSLIDLLADILFAATRMDTRAIIRVLMTHNLVTSETDIDLLEGEITELLFRYTRIPLKQAKMKAVFEDAIDVMTRYKIRVPANLTVLGKAMGTFEEVARMLDPDINLIEEIEPYIKKLTLRKLNPKRITADALSLFDTLADFVSEAPSDLKRLTRTALRGELGMVMKIKNIEKLSSDVDRASNRLSTSLIIAAIIIGSSVLMTIDAGATFYGIPLVGVLGYLIAAVLGIWLVISIIRSGRL